MKLRFNRALDFRMREMIEKRNYRLRDFFSSKNLDVELTGDAENPMIVLGQSINIAAYVKNMDLIFLDRPYSRSIQEIFKLSDVIEGTRKEVLQLIKDATHQGLYKICDAKSGLYLAGYNFKDPSNRRGRYPVFSREMSILYKTLARATEMKSVLDEDGYNVEVAMPDLDRLAVHLGFRPEVEYFEVRPTFDKEMYAYEE